LPGRKRLYQFDFHALFPFQFIITELDSPASYQTLENMVSLPVEELRRDFEEHFVWRLENCSTIDEKVDLTKRLNDTLSTLPVHQVNAHWTDVWTLET